MMIVRFPRLTIRPNKPVTVSRHPSLRRLGFATRSFSAGRYEPDSHAIEEFESKSPSEVEAETRPNPSRVREYHKRLNQPPKPSLEDSLLLHCTQTAGQDRQQDRIPRAGSIAQFVRLVKNLARRGEVGIAIDLLAKAVEETRERTRREFFRSRDESDGVWIDLLREAVDEAWVRLLPFLSGFFVLGVTPLSLCLFDLHASGPSVRRWKASRYVSHDCPNPLPK